MLISTFIIEKMKMFQTQRFSMQYKFDLYRPIIKLTVYQNGVYSRSLLKIKSLSTDIKQLQVALKEFLLFLTFYSFDKFVSVSNVQHTVIKSLIVNPYITQ